MSIVDHERQELSEAVQIDPHGIEPIPDADRDSTPIQQFWIWAGANIAPINWVLGALGIVLGLSLIETIIVVALGNLVGCALFGLFCVMGHRTGVNQMVLSRSAFGRRGAYVPGVAQLLLTMGWVGVNTWVVLDLTLGVLDEIGVSGGTGLKYVIGFLLMARAGRDRDLRLLPDPHVREVHGAGRGADHGRHERARVDEVRRHVEQLDRARRRQAHVDLAAADGDRHRLGDLVVHLLVGLHALRVAQVHGPAGVLGDRRSACSSRRSGSPALGASIASAGSETDPSQLVASVFGVMTIPVLLLIMHGPIATNILNLYSCSLAALSIGLKTARWKVTAVGRRGRQRRAGRRSSSPESFATSFDNWIVSIIVWISPWAGVTLVEYFVLRRGKVDVPALYEPPDRSTTATSTGRRSSRSWSAWRPAGRGSTASSVRSRARSPRRSATRTSRGPRACSSPAACTGCSRASACGGRRPPRAVAPVVTTIDVPAREGRGVRVGRRAALPRDRRRGRPGRRHVRLPGRRHLRVPLGRAHARVREPPVPAAGRALRDQPPASDPPARGGPVARHPRHAVRRLRPRALHRPRGRGLARVLPGEPRAGDGRARASTGSRSRSRSTCS